MSSRSLNGEDLNLKNLTVSNTITLENANVDDLSADIITCEDLTVKGNSELLGDVSMNSNCLINGNLTVNGPFVSNQMEIVYEQITGNAGSVNQSMPLYKNTTNTTNYSVFPSIYYGFSGSNGTYDANATSGAIQQIIITNRQVGSFDWNMQKSTGDNVNVFIVFLIVYDVYSSGYPSSY